LFLIHLKKAKDNYNEDNYYIKRYEEEKKERMLVIKTPPSVDERTTTQMERIRRELSDAAKYRKGSLFWKILRVPLS
jgi:hypothetical protein